MKDTRRGERPGRRVALVLAAAALAFWPLLRPAAARGQQKEIVSEAIKVLSKLIREGGPARSTSVFPILMYDSDIGLGYGGRLKIVDQLARRESLDLIVFGSSRGEQWFFFQFSVPDPELRQGQAYPFSLDVKAEYDKYGRFGFFGIGNDAARGNLTSCLHERKELQIVAGRGVTGRLVIEGGLTFRSFETRRPEPDRAWTDALAALGRQSVSIASASVRYDTSDSRLHPTRGVRLRGLAERAMTALGGRDGDFTRFTLDARGYRRFLGERSVLAVRLLAQHVAGRRIPLWELSMIGGGGEGSALRGFAMNRFMDSGKAIAVAEWRVPLLGRLGGVLFLEGGTVWPEKGGPDLRRVAADAGAGLRYCLDDFVVRLDVGMSREGPGVYFNFGQLF